MTARAWLEAILRGELPRRDFSAQGERLLEAAEYEGVVSLVYTRILEPELSVALPADVRKLFANAARAVAMQSLLREMECRRLLEQLDGADIPTLLLKGSALAYWAYPSPNLRECGDIDILIRSSEHIDKAISVLRAMAYLPCAEERHIPGDMICFETTFVRAVDSAPSVEIDLHWRLSSAPVFAYRFSNDELWRGAIPLPRLAPNAFGLGAVLAYLHACMHRVQNMEVGVQDRLKWLYDIHLLGSEFTAVHWTELIREAVSRGLAGTCLDGIRASEAVFGENSTNAVREALADSALRERMDVTRMNSWAYVQWMNFLAFPKLGMRLRWLRQRVIPDRTYLQLRYGKGTGFIRLMATRLAASKRRLLGG